MRGYGAVLAKVLELFIAEFNLRLSRGRTERRRLHQECDRIWYSIDRKNLYRILDNLKLRGYLNSRRIKDGIEDLSLNQKGKSYFLRSQFRLLKIGKVSRRWNKKWRIVLFDVPESRKKVRDALRRKLKTLGFLEFQKSVFVFPYPCRDEINFVINYLDIPENVYYIESVISPDAHLRKHFSL